MAAKYDRAAAKMMHWDNMANKIAQINDVRIKKALDKEEKIQNKIDVATKRQDKILKVHKDVLNEKAKKWAETRQEISKKQKKDLKDSFKVSNDRIG